MKFLRFVGITLLMIACGEDDPLGDAWNLWSKGKYVEAHAAFSDLIDSKGSEARVGLGWTTMQMDSLPEANGYFASAAPDSLLHGYAGWALASWLSEDYLGCIARAEFVLGKRPNFVFTYDRTLIARELLLAQGYSYYHLSNYPQVIVTIRKIEPSYTAPTPGTEATALLAKLDELSRS